MGCGCKKNKTATQPRKVVKSMIAKNETKIVKRIRRSTKTTKK